MTNQPKPLKPTSKFGTVSDQFATIGQGKKAATEPQEEAHTEREVTTSKHTEVKNVNSSEVKTFKEEKGQQTIRLPLSLRKWLRTRAPVEERDLSDIVANALEDYRKKVENE